MLAAGENNIGAVLQTNTLDTELEGFWGTLNGFTYGLQYDPHKPGPCYLSVESVMELGDEILALL